MPARRAVRPMTRHAARRAMPSRRSRFQPVKLPSSAAVIGADLSSCCCWTSVHSDQNGKIEMTRPRRCRRQSLTVCVFASGVARLRRAGPIATRFPRRGASFPSFGWQAPEPVLAGESGTCRGRKARHQTRSSFTPGAPTKRQYGCDRIQVGSAWVQRSSAQGCADTGRSRHAHAPGPPHRVVSHSE